MFNNSIKLKKKHIFFNKKNINIFLEKQIFFKKIKFNLTGKIFKWAFDFYKITFGVHFSHKTQLFLDFKNFIFNKIDKKNFSFLIFLIPRLKFFYRIKKKFRYIDIFNNRGVKLNTLYVFKKRGKVSRYM